ncbi:hypothetical protein FM038_013140 [Shewanella eurypsychrophilus]|uniref:Uncharacterized protein n=1 Tax=Shewanella eurypsychrophilus TaxID=2593656 RepID=A0ABX6V8Z7_9GAMM|nr:MULTISPECIES: hypothetical protein [Shewanella]QFU23000.1 hypothetical protein FS418_14725 [Shewanella sp. YLB-09]QPG58286.1 hypothetical protein FM038_013140 [Shewanella eurypsychrophilus]
MGDKLRELGAFYAYTNSQLTVALADNASRGFSGDERGYIALGMGLIAPLDTAEAVVDLDEYA